jgi:hypothetical protein
VTYRLTHLLRAHEIARAGSPTRIGEIGEGDLALSFVSDLAEESGDPAVIAGLGKLTAFYNDAQAMLLVGKTALARGLP